jgi:uncharacterized protein (TIGR02301 family)
MAFLRTYLLALALVASLPAAAQAPAQDRAPYETALSQLAEILGALHYLRPLCGASEQGQWRNEMQALLDAAQLSPGGRNLLVTSFNRGYVSYEQTYRSCTPAASLAIRRFLDEGARLSRDIATRYSN